MALSYNYSMTSAVRALYLDVAYRTALPAALRRLPEPARGLAAKLAGHLPILDSIIDSPMKLGRYKRDALAAFNAVSPLGIERHRAYVAREGVTPPWWRSPLGLGMASEFDLVSAVAGSRSRLAYLTWLALVEAVQAVRCGDGAGEALLEELDAAALDLAMRATLLGSGAVTLHLDDDFGPGF